MALQLNKMGISHIRLLEGGFDAWTARGYDLEVWEIG